MQRAQVFSKTGKRPTKTDPIKNESNYTVLYKSYGKSKTLLAKNTSKKACFIGKDLWYLQTVLNYCARTEVLRAWMGH